MSVPIDHLQQLLTHITTRRWLYDFLFNDDPLADLVVLRTQRCKAFLYQSTTTTKEPTNSHYTLLDERTEQLSLCVPHFTSDDITAGIVAHERTVNSDFPDLRPEPQNFQLARFARMSSPPLNLQVRALPDRSAIEVTMTFLPSTKRQSWFQFTFNGDPFHHHYASDDRTSYPDIDELRIALAKFSKAELCRACPHCHVPATTCCKCDTGLDFNLPKHPYDLHTERRCNSLYRGSYTGVVMVDYLRNGDPALHANLDCTHYVEGVTDSFKKSKLLETAVQWSAVQIPLQTQRRRNRVENGVDENCNPAYSDYCADGSVDEQSGLSRPNDFATNIAEKLIQKQMSTTKQENTKQELEIISVEPHDITSLPPIDHEIYRKTRNRLSAAKSNTKRKWRNRSMRLQVVILRQRLSTLREKENALKCDREWLRQQCSRNQRMQ